MAKPPPRSGMSSKGSPSSLGTHTPPIISGVILKWSAKRTQFLKLDLGEGLETSNPVS